MAESYDGTVVWGKDMVRHAALMARGGGVEWSSVRIPPTRMLMSSSTWSPSGNGRDSTSYVDVVVDLAWARAKSFRFLEKSKWRLPHKPHRGSAITRADAKALQALETMKLFHDFDSVVTLESLASIRKHYSGQGGYYLTSQTGFRVEGAPSNNKGWKAWFLFVSRHRGWGFGVKWSAHPVNNVPPNLSDEESNLVRRLKGILSASWAIRSLTEEWLVEAGFSPSSCGTP
ncbi:hypothetical protein B296_00024675 [Ensete ventricosum]|uniref:Uncharacterized protein n=1 Tax=Ensete ventricosum TaxID=4639 RepID=A0A427ANJ1_ENSVE|nr:hypothetical protein B296_00024675 [Ensete ventricosum]